MPKAGESEMPFSATPWPTIYAPIVDMTTADTSGP